MVIAGRRLHVLLLVIVLALCVELAEELINLCVVPAIMLLVLLLSVLLPLLGGELKVRHHEVRIVPGELRHGQRIPLMGSALRLEMSLCLLLLTGHDPLLRGKELRLLGPLNLREVELGTDVCAASSGVSKVSRHFCSSST